MCDGSAQFNRRTSPATVLKNLHRVEPTIYWKALLEILARICEGPQLSLERDIVMYQSYVHGRPRLLAEDATAPPVDADAPGWRYTFCRTEEEQLGACGGQLRESSTLGVRPAGRRKGLAVGFGVGRRVCIGVSCGSLRPQGRRSRAVCSGRSRS